MLAHLTLLFAILIAPPSLAQTQAEMPLSRWQELRDPDAPLPSFEEAFTFLHDHPGWPDAKTIRIRAEAAALSEQPEPDRMRVFCAEPGPISGRGMFACLRAQVGEAADRRSWLHKGWIQGDFSESEERSILRKYGAQFSREDHIARTERLLYEGKLTPAKRMLDVVPAAYRMPFKTWIAFAQNDRNTDHLLATLSPEEKNQSGLRFAKAKQAAADKRYDALVSVLKDIPESAHYPEQWWPLRQLAIREAIGDRKFSLALSLARKHGDLSGEALAEALWLKGWLWMIQEDPREAYKVFHKLYTEVSTPVSKARAAYWAGRAATQNGNPDIATEWWHKAAKYPTVFYGQLAHLTLAPSQPLALPEEPAASSAEKKRIADHELGRAARLLMEQGDTKTAERFLAALVAEHNSPETLAAVAAYAKDIRGKTGGVKAAKWALRKRIVLVDYGWPRESLPESLPIEKALSLAITRQESEFDPKARSSANAQGLMQLLPETARQVARKLEVAFSEADLENPHMNIMLGSTYLRQLIDGFDGSYILGVASYNAGPANVRKWIAANGSPPKTLDGALYWIESIPFTETRNYVMRVLENLQLYRHLESPKEPPQLIDDMTR